MFADLMSSHRVSAAEFVRGFGQWRERASQAPVTITNHGRDTHVLISAPSFTALKAAGAHNTQPTATLDASLIDRVRDCILIVDPGFIIRRANAAACDYFNRSAPDLEGSHLERASPKVGESLAMRGLQRALINGERSAIDVPSVTRESVWLHVETFPVEGGAAVFFRDITSEVETHRVADVKQAIIEAMGADGRIGYMRISPREMIQCSDQASRDMLGLADEALRRGKFSSILVPRARARFHEVLERVFLGARRARLESCLFANSGREIPVGLSIVELRGGLASEGAIVAITLSDSPAT
jgi:PAS domain-containing protein